MNRVEAVINKLNDEYFDVIKDILKLNAMYLIDFDIANYEDDTNCATDYKIRVCGGDIAARMRFDEKTFARNNKVYRDFTIRCRSKYGNKTEIDKLREGFAKWYLYIWVRIDGKFDWVLLDLDKMRELEILNIERKSIPNGDGTEFINIPVSEYIYFMKNCNNDGYEDYVKLINTVKLLTASRN